MSRPLKLIFLSLATVGLASLAYSFLRRGYMTTHLPESPEVALTPEEEAAIVREIQNDFE